MTIKKAFLYGAIVISLLVIGFYSINPKQDIKDNSSQTDSIQNGIGSKSESSDTQNTTNSESISNVVVPDKNASTPTSPQIESKKTDTVTNKQSENTNIKSEPPVNTVKKAETPSKPVDAAIIIKKSDITPKARFYAYKADGITMEVIAVKASDGTVRTALNTCQVCFDSGKGYYVQVGENLICQNCKNKFHIDQVEKVKGGCNPVPILGENKKDIGDSIAISKEYLVGQKKLL